jgi:tetratricopeptide (TPR) repeat protein
VVLGLFSVLAINSIYLASVTVAEWASGETIQNYFYQYMFLAHLALGLLFVVPLLAFGALHIRNAHNRPNRLAVRAGYGLFAASLILLGSGLLLTRLEGLIEVKSPAVRSGAYWAHVLSPLAIVWLFILHRLAGPRIRWRAGLLLGGAGAAFAIFMVAMHSQDPRRWNVTGPASGEKYFFPSLARTATGNFIPARTLMMDDYCLECHPDVYEGWAHSAHRFSSFNNPAYLFSVKETRRALLERDGNVQGSRFCAGCHDPVPFFSGAFDDPEFDRPDFDPKAHPTAAAGVTCTTCHAITNVNSVRGNSDYTIEEPTHYPFAFSDNPFLGWLNRQLVKAKPAFHKKTFLKPLHKTPEFCGSCHKVHLPVELNAYRWLRGQNHYDAYHLSGVSGHGVTSFYYPPVAQHDCNGCHMPLVESQDFGARHFDDSGKLKVHKHQFPSANTALPHLLGMPAWVNEEHRKFNDGVMRLDIFGVKEGGAIDGALTAPLGPEVPALEPGATYLIEVVVRTVKMGHLFTQGTADSNEVWLDVAVTSGAEPRSGAEPGPGGAEPEPRSGTESGGAAEPPGNGGDTGGAGGAGGRRVIGRSGGLRDDGAVDPWSHFVNAYVLDREGNRIDRRNAQDIFIALYNHQIPPGAADVVHYRLTVPAEQTAPLTFEAQLRYRKFDTTYMQHVYGKDFKNDLPVMTLASDRVTFPVGPRAGGAGAGGAGAGDGAAAAAAANEASPIPAWERWNDYGIGLFLKGSEGAQKGELRQAEEAFREVERLGRGDGPLNLARVYIKEGRLEEAVAALRRAAGHSPPAPPWSVAWFTGIVNRQNGHLDKAIESFQSVVETRFAEARERGFDFGEDYRALIELGQTLFERSNQERGPANDARRRAFLAEARKWFEKALELDPENATAHYDLSLVLARLGDEKTAAAHRALHLKYKTDDNARDRAIAEHRRKNPAADHAAETIVIYDLQRPGAYELAGAETRSD